MADETKPWLENGVEGKMIGRDPRKMTRDELISLGHKVMSPLEALRARCLDCCAGSPYEVRNCTARLCPSWPFRMGSHPWLQRATPTLTDDQVKARDERMRKLGADRAARRREGQVGSPTTEAKAPALSGHAANEAAKAARAAPKKNSEVSSPAEDKGPTRSELAQGRAALGPDPDDMVTVTIQQPKSAFVEFTPRPLVLHQEQVDAFRAAGVLPEHVLSEDLPVSRGTLDPEPLRPGIQLEPHHTSIADAEAEFLETGRGTFVVQESPVPTSTPSPAETKAALPEPDPLLDDVSSDPPEE